VVNGDHAEIVKRLSNEILHADETNPTKPVFVDTLRSYMALQPAHATAPPATADAAQPDWRQSEEVTAYLENDMPLEWQLLWEAVHNGSTQRVGLVVDCFSRRTFSLSVLPPPLTPSTKLLVIFLARCVFNLCTSAVFLL
jgi:hypothetical protein